MCFLIFFAENAEESGGGEHSKTRIKSVQPNVQIRWKYLVWNFVSFDENTLKLYIFVATMNKSQPLLEGINWILNNNNGYRSKKHNVLRLSNTLNFSKFSCESCANPHTDVVTRLESFRAHKTFQFWEFKGPKTHQIGDLYGHKNYCKSFTTVFTKKVTVTLSKF